MTIETYLPLILYIRNRIVENDRDSEDKEDKDSVIEVSSENLFVFHLDVEYK